MTVGVAPRAQAAELLRRITEEGAHSNVLLTKGGPSHAVVQRLVLDVLRQLPVIDATVAALGSRSLDDLDELVRSVLRIGVLELMTGGDAHGVVNSAVEVIKRSPTPRAAGYVNAVLRRVAAGARPTAPDDETAAAWAVASPSWIRRRLVEAWGVAEADAFLRGSLEKPQIGIRNRPGSAFGTAVRGIPGAAYVAARSDVAAAGDGVVVMDPASTAVAAAVAAEPGQRVLDVAAAPGNKTSALWDAMGGDGLLVASDRHRRRARSAGRRLRRMGVDAAWVVSDGGRPPFRPASFDRVLLDAPCTGLGTLRRRPEIKMRLDPAAPQRMAAVQQRLVDASLRLLRPGGRLVYSVCTVFAEETIDIAASHGGRLPEGLPGREWGGGLLLAPHLTGTDGMFITVFEPHNAE